MTTTALHIGEESARNIVMTFAVIWKMDFLEGICLAANFECFPELLQCSDLLVSPMFL